MSKDAPAPDAVATSRAILGKSKHKATVIIIVAAVVLVALCCISLLLGRFPIAPHDAVMMMVNEIFPVDQSWTDQESALFFNVRLPRILLAMLVGCGLSAAGAAYQGTF